MATVFWTLGKVCFLLIVIAFCLPIAYGLNGFQIAHNDISTSGLSFALYVLFISAMIGLLLCIFNNMFLEVDALDILWSASESRIFNLIIVGICLCSGLIPFFINLKEHSGNYQIGIYLIIIGLALTLIFHIISFIFEINESGSSKGTYSKIDSGNNSSSNSNNSNNNSSSNDDYYFPDVCP